MIGDKAIQRFQSEVNWAASDAAARATILTRELLLGHARVYLAGGDQALGAFHNDKTPRVFADAFHQVLWQSKGLGHHAAVCRLPRRVSDRPTPGVGAVPVLGEGWSRPGGVDLAAPADHLSRTCWDVFVADKQLYASRYLDAALVVVSLASAPQGKGFYALVAARARSTMLRGTGARLLRGRVEERLCATGDDVPELDPGEPGAIGITRFTGSDLAASAPDQASPPW